MTNHEERKKKGKKWGILLFILFNLLVIAVTAYQEFLGSENAADVRLVHIRFEFLIPACTCAVAAILAETFKYMILMKKATGTWDFGICLKTVVYGRYYDNITPSGVGGQPFQIYYMRKRGVSPAASASIPLSAFMSMQYGFVLLALGTFLFGGDYMQSRVARVAGWFGIALYALFPTVILMFTVFPRFSRRVLGWIVSLLAKFRIVKDKEKTAAKTERTIEEYVECNKTVFRTPWLVPVLLLFGVFYQAAICAVPYFVIEAFGGNLDFFECFATTVSIYAAITFIPTPGNMGAAEGTFYAVFSSVSEGIVFWAMLSWRFFTCYGFILLGLLLYLERAVVSKKRRDANEKRNEERAEIGTDD